MRLTKEQSDWVLDRFNEKAASAGIVKCPYCGAGDYNLEDTIGTVPSFNPGLLFAGIGGLDLLASAPRSIPVVVVCCIKCGAVASFSAVLLGVVSKEGAFLGPAATVDAAPTSKPQ